MKRKIHLLSEETINQIAAGEVIESPASVIKELIENALDAEAKKVRIEIAGGGLKKIRIVDDGVGMEGEDARISIVRHATSKISAAADLFHVATKGFRGEALASIASISKMRMQTALEEGLGIELEVEKGAIVKERPCARLRGTTIEVDSLFYNVPARKKFQKSAAAISAEIFRIVITLALSHPEIHFELISNKRMALQTRATDLRGRAEELLGPEFTGGSFPMEFSEASFHFTGIMGSPQNTRTNRMGQFLFLNRRAVMCPPIYEAIREGYGTRIEERRHPIFLLYLDVPSHLVDVNVHPQKLQVRLQKEEFFREKVSKAVSGALKEPVKIFDSEIVFTEVPTHFEELSFRMQEEVEEREFTFEKEFYQAMGQVGRFLLYHDQEANELLLVDAEAASFQLLFENLKKKSGEKASSQGLLIPFTFSLTPLESAMVLTHLDAIEKMGFSLRPVRKEEFRVEAIPPFVEESEVSSVIAEMASALQEFIGGRDYALERQEKLAWTLAHHAKRKTTYLSEEALLLLKQLLKEGAPLYCPKGNPIIVRLKNDEIEALFRKNQETTKSS